MAEMEHCKGAVIEALKETFLKYLQPKVILEKFIALGKLKAKDFDQTEDDREQLVQLFLEWLLDNNESTQLVELFVSSLKENLKESMVIGSTHRGNGLQRPFYEYFPDVFNMIGGTLIQALNREDLDYIFDKMMALNLLLKQKLTNSEKEKSDYVYCLQLFNSVRARKPDWPFHFIDIIATRKPEILALYNEEKNTIELQALNASTISESSSSTCNTKESNSSDTLNGTKNAADSSISGINQADIDLQLKALNASTISESSSLTCNTKERNSSILDHSEKDAPTQPSISDSQLKVLNASTINESSSSTSNTNESNSSDTLDHTKNAASTHSSISSINQADTTSTVAGNALPEEYGSQLGVINISSAGETLPSVESTASTSNIENENYCANVNHTTSTESSYPSITSVATDEDITKNKSTIKNLETGMQKIGISVPHPISDDYKPKRVVGPASIASSGFSSLAELSWDYTDTKSNLSGKREITVEERNSPEVNSLLKNGVIDENLLKVEEHDNKPTHIHDAHNSDSENDLDDSETLNLGVKKLIADSEAPPLNLRQYQLELATYAVQGFNTVICAPTGSGKTRVATHIILEHLKKDKRKTVAFLTRTIPLTMQQYKVLSKALSNYSVTHITGQSQDSLELKTFVKRNDVVVLTPMILVNHLRSKSVRLRNFSLLIFDECHHTRKDEPYNLVMFMYLKTKFKGSEKMRSNLPQIVGLSATIGIDRARNVTEASDNILKICGNLDAPYLSTVKKNIEELIRLVPIPQEFDFQLKERDANDALNRVMSVMSKLEKHAEYASNELNDTEIKDLVKNAPRNKKSQDYGKWTVDLKSAAKSVPIDDKYRETKEPVRTLIIIADYLWNYNVALESHDLVELRDVMDYLKKRFEKFSNKKQRTENEDTFYLYFQDLIDLVKQRSEEGNPNLSTLAKILLINIVKKGSDSRGIIFVRTRALAEALSSWLKRCGIPELEELNASVFTGTNAKAEEGGMSQVQQEDTIREFRAGTIKVLVATSVAEEGLDIPDCNLVVKYNHVGNEITTVQTKGRSRKRGGVAYLLGMDNILRKEYVNREKEKLMKKSFVKIDDMSLEEREAFIKKYQLEIIQEAEIEEALAARRKKQFKDVDFTMVCSLCRKISIEKKNIRLIFDKFRVSIDREILKGQFMECIPMRSQFIDEMELIGPVFCRGQPREGVICGHKLGTMVKYGGLHYFAIGIKNFGFYKNSQEKLEHYKMWKSVPYFVEDLSHDDIKKYADIPLEDSNAVDPEDDEDSSDDDDNIKKNRIPLIVQSKKTTEDELRDITTHPEESPGDVRNSVTHSDIQSLKPTPVTGSLAEKVESELGKSPSLTSKMEDEIKTEKSPTLSSVACSESGSEDSLQSGE
ncbi:interferon-induced helicase C domain-containing protein 1-like isoform X1 [Biomphalaria glabrata]|uniref:RNA helicase n=2 Tax=Biomphalaria glabrata TaxID=6526 RepID=A0A9W2YSC4_BIOGL|nr:interferon-induced helicase C domain-containing protein 1-like isoform X1 [Biomphalaria glabrata]XP_055865698.1 interferon-induced helicase C domain-containing protein 1-like isoform X1 [Biomphalaria glabrata]